MDDGNMPLALPAAAGVPLMALVTVDTDVDEADMAADTSKMSEAFR